MKLGSLFDGAGTFPFAAQICGIEPVWAAEIEPFPVKVTAARFPKMKQLGDVTKINGAEYKETRQGGIILNNDNEETRKLVEHCHMQSKVMVNPIVDWTDNDVWEFLRHYGCKSNPLYECGFKRVGCIGCPMASQKKRYEEFALYPKYEASYKRAFAKMLEKRKEKNLPTQWETAEDVFRWWMEEDYTQLRFSDLGVMR